MRDAGTKAGRGRFGLVVAIALLLAACSALEPAPARQLDLSGTAWLAVVIDDEELDPAVPVAFPNLDEVIIGEGCLQYRGGVALDTDGEAISFGDFVPIAPNPCPSSPAITAESDLIRALADAEVWRIAGDSIEITGSHEVLLNRR